MNKVPDIIPVTDLRQDAATIIKQIKSSNQPLIITQRGRAAAVMLSIKEYEQIQHNMELLRLLAKGEEEIQAGEGFDLDTVLAEADALLEQD